MTKKLTEYDKKDEVSELPDSVPTIEEKIAFLKELGPKIDKLYDEIMTMRDEALAANAEREKYNANK